MDLHEHPGEGIRARLARARNRDQRVPLSPIAHEDRARLFQGCIELLCARAGVIAKLCGMSRGSCRWHLDILARSGYVAVWHTAFGTRYAPCGVVEDLEMANALSLVLSPGCANTILDVSGSPGISARETRNPRRLESAGLLRSMRNGRNVRWYPGDGLAALHRAVEMGRVRLVVALISLLEQHMVEYHLSDARPLLSIDLQSPYGTRSFAIPLGLLAFALRRYTILCK